MRKAVGLLFALLLFFGFLPQFGPSDTPGDNDAPGTGSSVQHLVSPGGSYNK
jgi:hypothetical protein